MTDPESRIGRHRIDGVQDPEDPQGRRRISVWLNVTSLDWLYKTNRWKAFNLKTAVQVLRNPDRVYRGIRKDDGGQWVGWCFVAVVETFFSSEDGSYPAPLSKVFAAFIDEGGHLFEWGEEERDQADPKAPKDTDKRFGGLQWKT